MVPSQFYQPAHPYSAFFYIQYSVFSIRYLLAFPVLPPTPGNDEY
jgi:hypothetical protein